MTPTANGIVTLPSLYSVHETLDRLEVILREKGIKVFTRIDQAAEAAAVGLTMPPTQLLIFGNPKGGTPIMVAAPLAALDLPLKALAWQDVEGAVWVSFNQSSYLQTRFAIPEPLLTPINGLPNLIQQAIS
jgi:uncharacterized protein (DUF302 family)